MRVQKLDNQTVGVFFEYSPNLVQIIKSLPGRTYEPRLRAWLLPSDGLLGDNLAKLAAAGFDVSAVEGMNSQPNVPAQPINGFIAPDLPIFSKLYPFQKKMAEWMIQAQSGLLCSFCGSGKTITSIAALEALGCRNNLIICPKSVLINWQREIKQWLNIPSVVISGTPAERKRLHVLPAKFTIMTYDTLRIDLAQVVGKQWDGVIFDEAHYLVNTTSQRHKAAKFLKAKYKFGATATPIMNAALDIYGIFKVLGKDLGSYPRFMERYCVKDIWGSVKYYKNMDELAKRIAPWLKRITLEDTHFELPPKTETDLEFELSDNETSLYNRIKKELLFELEQAEVSKLSSPMVLQNTLTKLGKLQELTDSCELIGELTQSSKLEILKEHLENNLYDQKAIIFTRFERMAQILRRELSGYNPCVLTGQVSDRQSVIDKFTSDKTARLFISTEAGGVGVNLQSASIVYNYDLPFSLGKLEQRQGRIRWHQQTTPVFFYNLMAKLKGGKDTIDQFVKNKLLGKQEIADKLLLADIKEILSI